MSQADKDRHTGKVVRSLRDYGFIAAAGIASDVYFKHSWFTGSPPLREGDTVTFKVKQFGDDFQADSLRRSGEPQHDGESPSSRSASAPTNSNLLDWAYLGFLPNTLAELKSLALDERWEFMNVESDPERPLPILRSYLAHTFGRLVMEGKVSVCDKRTFAAFNTGLVDRRFECIYALFVPNQVQSSSWQLSGFCIAGEGANGQNLVRHFNPLPRPAHYFDQPIDLLYDIRMGKPELSWDHIIIDHIDRYPMDFLQDHWPAGFKQKDASAMSEEDREQYYVDLGNAVRGDNRIYRRIMNRMKDAVDLSIKRVTWNYKTAIPQYYSAVRQLQLLLPICLVSDEMVDLAMAVEKTPSGTYLAHTVLPLDWAYRNARLICRPDSDWLAPQNIAEVSAIDHD